MIVGTAGHIDHGKTALVRALTGVDTDRLPEEKARGISIELGYAYLDVPPALGAAAAPAPRIGFVDVPGHERLVRTMLAGATGIDFGLLVVAADDGVMPQTREHLAVLALLGLQRGIAVLTKADRVDAARLAAVAAEVGALLAGTPLAAAPVLAVSSTAGMGLDCLRALLFEAARRGEACAGGADRTGQDAAPRAPSARAASIDVSCGEPGFRLAIDRSFTLPGIGTVVTGSVLAGRVAVGDALQVAPLDGRVVRGRVRSLHAADRPVAVAGAGERCAIALAGIDREQVGRGRWLVAPTLALTTTRLDVRLSVWRDEPRAVHSGTTVHLHLGTSDVLASVAVLGSDAPDAPDVIAPGGSGIVQLVLREPIAAWHGDRIVLRDASASRTLAGGRVLDPFAPTRYRRTSQRQAEWAAWQSPTASERLDRLVDAAPFGVSIERWALAEGRVGVAAADGIEARLLAGVGHGGQGVGRAGVATDARSAAGWLLAAPAARAIERRSLAALEAFHARHPELPGIDAAALRRLVAPRLPEPLWRMTLAALEARGDIVLHAALASLAAHAIELSAADAMLFERMEPRIAVAGVEGVWVRDLARADGSDEAALRTGLSRLARRGALHQVTRDLYWTDAEIVRLAALVRALAATDAGTISAARFRDAVGVGRKRAIQLLEYFDRLGLLQRVGDRHRVRAESRLFSETRSAAVAG